MKYNDTVKGIFISRPNRFIAVCSICGEEQLCHVRNTGRCTELLTYMAEVILCKNNNPNRKTKYTLIAVYKNDLLINMDSLAPNKAAYQWLNEGNLIPCPNILKAEVTFDKSRFDFYVISGERKAFVEVKGVTLENNGVVSFPDAPTERGLKHINELIKAKEMGYEAYILFVIQMSGVLYFTPNYKTHKAFGEALKLASKKGVGILAYDCNVNEDSIEINKAVKIIL